jgi:hypothetical protein
MKKHLIIQIFILIIVIIAVHLVNYSSSGDILLSSRSIIDIEAYDKVSDDHVGKSISNFIMNSVRNTSFIDTLKNKSKNYKNILIVRFSDINCSACRSIDVPILSNFTLDSTNVVYISSYSNEDDVNFFKRVNQLKGDILPIDTPLMAIDSELINSNYYILLDNNLQILEFFIASSYHSDRIIDFFNRVLKY